MGPKKTRSRRACDECHKQACRCSPSPNNDVTKCKRCEDHAIPCTYQRPTKRRGPPARRAQQRTDASQVTEVRAQSQLPAQTESVHSTPVHHYQENEAIILSPNIAETVDFYQLYEHAIPTKTIETLVDVYYHALYPLRPYFHWPTYRDQVQRQSYRTNRGLFVVTMAVAALAAQRLCDGDPVPSSPHSLRNEGSSLHQKCYAAAVNTMPPNLESAPDLYQLMKGKALLASGCLHLGDLNKAIAHLGDYTSFAAILGFHNESNWSNDLSQIEIQERRRLFWGTYQSDMYMTNMLGAMFRQREAKVSVLYPAEVFDDQDISESSIRHRRDTVSWLRGFNFCTDMYRLLEHSDSIIKMRSEISQDGPGSQVSAFLSRLSEGSASECLQLVNRLHSNLPPELKRVSAVTGDPHSDRCSFIAFNILITSQTLKMLLAGGENSSVHLRCAIGNELLDELSTISLSFFHGSSIVTLQHLAQVGYLLGSAIRDSLSIWTFVQVRNILLVLAHFLEKIESTRSSEPKLARKLRSQIKKIDDYMQQTPPSGQDPGLLLIDQSLVSALSNSSVARSNELRHPSPQRRNTEAASQVPLSTTAAQSGLPSTLRDQGETNGNGNHSSLSRTFMEAFDSSVPITDELYLPQDNSLPNDVFSDWPFMLDQPSLYQSLANDL